MVLAKSPYPKIRRKQPRYPKPDFGRVSRDTMQVVKMGVAGAVGIGMIGAVGSLIKKP
jgi:hypothetical protein